MSMNMKQLKYVVTVSKTGSFHKAAEELGISQPSLSQYIKKIESEIGLQLFNRSGTNIRLTDAGRIFIENGKKILAIEHKMETEFANLSEFKTGSVIIGASPFRASCMMPKVTSELRKLYPGIHLVIREESTDELLDAMLHGECDLCLITLPVDEEFFDVDVINSEEILLAVPENANIGSAVTAESRKYPAADAKVLDGKDFVMLSENQIMQRSLDFLCEQEKISVKKAAVCNSIETQINMVSAGVGFALVPSGIEGIAPRNVRFFSLIQELPRRKCGIIRRKDQPLSRVCSDIIDIMKN